MPSASLSESTPTMPTRHENAKPSTKRSDERVDAVRVVGRVHQDERRGAHGFEATGRGHVAKGGLHEVRLERARGTAVGQERFDGREREQRVVRLVLAV